MWLPTIARNAFVTWVKDNRSGRMVFVRDTSLAETADTDETVWGSNPRDPEALLTDSTDSQALNRPMATPPSDYREVLLLREVEGLSYKTPMSRARR